MDETGRQLIEGTQRAAMAGQAFLSAMANGTLAYMDGDDVAGLATLAAANPNVLPAQMGMDVDKANSTPARVYGSMMKMYYGARMVEDHRVNEVQMRADAEAATERRLARLERHSPRGAAGLAEALGSFDGSAMRKLEEDLIFS